MEPFGADRDNLHAGIIATTLANIHRGKGVPAYKVDDFMLRDPEEIRRRRTQQFMAWMQSVAVPAQPESNPDV
jgi:hypothetical protein